MANFDSANQLKVESVNAATQVVYNMKSLYNNAKQVQALLARYTANTDAAFNAAVNAMYTARERSELAAMLTQINTLVTDWESNHAWIKE